MDDREYQVTLQMEAVAPSDSAASEDDLVAFVDRLLNEASSIALGPAGSIDGTILELRFNVQADDMDELFDKLRVIAKILTGEDYEIAATNARRDRELALA